MTTTGSGELHEVFSDFNMLEALPEGSLRIPLGPESVAADLQGLAEGQCVRVLYSDELRAIGTVTSETHRGVRFCYALAERQSAPTSSQV